MAPGQLEQGLAGFWLHVRGVDHREPAELEPFGGDVMKDLEGMRRDSLVVFVVRNHCAACVGREHFAGEEVPARRSSCPSRWGRSERRG